MCEPPTIVLKPFVKVCCMSFNHCCDKCVSSFMPFSCSKDVRLPVQLQRAMAAEAEAAREARAKVGDHTVHTGALLLLPPDQPSFASCLGHRRRRRTKGQPGPSPGGGHRVRIAGRHPTAILAGPFAVANLRLAISNLLLLLFFPLSRPSTPFRPRRIQPSSFPYPLTSYRVSFHLLCRQHQRHRQQQQPPLLLLLKNSPDLFSFVFVESIPSINVGFFLVLSVSN